MKLKILCFLLYYVTRFLVMTYRFKKHNIHHLEEAKKHHPQQAIIVACWHEQLAGVCLSILSSKEKHYAPLISPSKDGELVAYVAHRYGHFPVRGSSHRRGREARNELYYLIKNGHSSGITIDGPKGSRRICKAGVVDIASKTNTAILPTIAVAEKKFIFHKSWDHFQLPFPFSTVHISYAQPITVPFPLQSDDFAKFKQEITDTLNNEEERFKKLEGLNDKI